MLPPQLGQRLSTGRSARSCRTRPTDKPLQHRRYDRFMALWIKTRTACLMPLAAARAGFVHVPVNPLLKALQVQHILGDSGARLLLTQPNVLLSSTVGGYAVRSDQWVDYSVLTSSK